MYEAPKSIYNPLQFPYITRILGLCSCFFSIFCPKMLNQSSDWKIALLQQSSQSSEHCKQRFERSLKAKGIFNHFHNFYTSHPIYPSITRFIPLTKSPRNANGFHQPRSSRWQGHCFCSRTKTSSCKHVWRRVICWYAANGSMNQLWKHMETLYTKLGEHEVREVWESSSIPLWQNASTSKHFNLNQTNLFNHTT